MPSIFLASLVIVSISAVATLIFLVLPDNQPPTEPATTTIKKGENTPTVVRKIEQRTNKTPAVDKEPPADTIGTETNAYKNGTYAANAEYFTPARKKHKITVTLAIRDDSITAVNTQYNGTEAETPNHRRFDDAYEPLTLGVAIDDLDLSRVGGASLTTAAFNEALTDIKSDASIQ